MPVEIDVSCDECGSAIESLTRYNNEGVYCGSCISDVRQRVEDLEIDLDNMKENYQEQVDINDELIAENNELAARVELLSDN